MSHILEPNSVISEFPQKLARLREELLANIVMMSQIPSPTGGEEQRVRYMLDRFMEAGVPESAEDDAGNAVALLPGKTGRRTIMLVAHLDTYHPGNLDHNVTVSTDKLIGAGIDDNSTGAAILSMLPTCLQELGIELDSNLMMLGTTSSLQRGNHAGLRFHLDRSTNPIDFGMVVEGVQLGRLNYFSIGTLRGDIRCNVRPEPSRTYGSENALVVLNSIINRILQIPIPSRPYTHITLAQIHAGGSYEFEPDHAQLGIQVISHSDAKLNEIKNRIEEIVQEMGARHYVEANIDFFFHRGHGGLNFSHPLIKATLDVMKQLDIAPDQGHSPSELSEFIARGIPAVTLGLTTGNRGLFEKHQNYIEIEPLLTGVAQLLGVLLAIDEGRCDE